MSSPINTSPSASRLLQAGSGVHDVADDDVRVVCCALAGALGEHELAGVDSDAHVEANAEVALELIVEALERGCHRRGGAHGA